jgi:hypothetical protein
MTNELLKLAEDYARHLVAVDFWSGKVTASAVLAPAYEAKGRLEAFAAALAAPPAGISPAPLAGSGEMTDAQMLEAMQEQREGAMALMFKERAQAVALREVLKQLLLEFGLKETFGIRLARAALSQGDVSGEGEGA